MQVDGFLKEHGVYLDRQPAWLEIQGTKIPPDAGPQLLAEGERETIILAQEHRRKRYWTRDLPSALERLRQTTFRASPSLLSGFTLLRGAGLCCGTSRVGRGFPDHLHQGRPVRLEQPGDNLCTDVGDDDLPNFGMHV